MTGDAAGVRVAQLREGRFDEASEKALSAGETAELLWDGWTRASLNIPQNRLPE